MAQADFDFYQIGTSPFGGVDGVAVGAAAFHGTYSRQYSWDGGLGDFVSISARLDAALQGGVFVGTPLTKAVSLRAHVKVIASAVETRGQNSIVLCARTPATTTPSGYFLSFGTLREWLGGEGIVTTLALRICKRTSGGLLDGAYPDVVVGVKSYSKGVFYPIRLDVIPMTSPTRDRLQVYEGTVDGSGNVAWTLAHTTDVLSTETVYSPPTATTRMGYNALFKPLVFEPLNDAAKCVIDAFEARLVIL